MNFIRESIQTLSSNVFTNESNVQETQNSHDTRECSVSMGQDIGGFATWRRAPWQMNNEISEGMRPILLLDSEVHTKRTVN